MSTPTGGWTDAWPRWALYALLWMLPVIGVLVCAIGLVLSVGWVAAGGSFLIPTGVLSSVFSCDISSKRLGYVALQTVSHRDTRRKERRAKRLCKERGIAKAWRLQFRGGRWETWTETLARHDREPDATPQELFVRGEIDMQELERHLNDAHFEENRETYMSEYMAAIERKKAAAQPES